MSEQIEVSVVYCIERVINWNSARYEQIFNLELTSKLLQEELDEFLVATTEVDQLDALMDIAYVAIGAMWKLGCDAEEIAEHICYESIQNKAIMPYVKLVNFAFETASYMLDMEPPEVISAFLVVCDSNDTKAIKKTSPNVKANIDKGAGFVRPEPTLQLILDRRSSNEDTTRH